MRPVVVVAVALSVSACGGGPRPEPAPPANAPPSPAPPPLITAAGVGPLDAMTSADASTLRRLLPGTDVRPGVDELEGESYPTLVVLRGEQLLLEVVPADDSTIATIRVHDDEFETAAGVAVGDSHDTFAAAYPVPCTYYPDEPLFPGITCHHENLTFVFSEPEGWDRPDDGMEVGGDAIAEAPLEVIIWSPPRER